FAAKSLRSETDLSARRALVLALGEMVTPDSPAGRSFTAVAAPFLQQLWHEHPDPGLHGAAEWTLRRWQRSERLRGPAKPLPSMRTNDKLPQWRTNALGQTLVLIPAPPPFYMGSPADEVGRTGGAKDQTEKRHLRRIGRSFAIATHPITVSQFQRFRADHAYNDAVSPGPDHPINTVTWYDAAAFCNWLSEQDGIPRDQWCYDPDGLFEEGMEVPEDFLNRLGYRLLTEPEWEFACRAGSQSSYYFGEGEELLKHYAWYTKTSNDQITLEVGRLKPNDLGLFDLSGNVLEWCNDWAAHYPTATTASEIADAPVVKRLDNRDTRILRGGSFADTASGVRSAYRYFNLPEDRYNCLGFRVARTYR
ncbi:MAG: formylglycine-generating enzyme family protein, partial [Planctomycetota bacterium]